MTWSILCDFDGTISADDVIDSLLSRYGRPGWESLEEAWRNGLIGSRECMQKQVGLLSLDRNQLDAHLESIGIDPDFPAFVAWVRMRGVPLRVVSDGLDYAIGHILARHGLDDLPVAANRLLQQGQEDWRLESPFQVENCSSGTCKCACADDARHHRRRVLLIGDGASDFCAAGHADFVFAKNRLADHCRAAGIPHIPVTGFGDVLGLLPHLLDGNPPGAGWLAEAIAPA